MTVKNLTKLKVGESGLVASIANDAGVLKKRLLDMGCITGTEITVKKLAPLGDPIEVSIKNYNLSLRKNEASKIEVDVQ